MMIKSGDRLQEMHYGQDIKPEIWEVQKVSGVSSDQQIVVVTLKRVEQ